jgi:16S rRNA (cytidine1402-2'-O)-methyltransferase
MPGTLYVVATPIGNLEDVTLRALRVLREVAVIAAEDTRRTAHLLQHYSISTRTTSLHAHNELRRVPGLVARLKGGESVALVSDAGTPLVSDPGRLLVTAAHEAGIRVEPIPGPSAVMAAMSASGLVDTTFVFAGFPPSRSKARIEWLTALSREQRAVVFYEAPHRIRATMAEARRILVDRPVCLARELTKKHEWLVVRPINEIETAELPEIGEYTIVLAGAQEDEASSAAVSPADVLRVFGEVTEKGGLSRRAAARDVASKLGLPPNEVYQILLEAKKSAE